MKAVIVAAGEGKRIADITGGKPKCLLEIGGTTLINRLINQLKQEGIKEIAIIVGYKKESIINQIDSSIKVIENPFYTNTNNMASLFCARDFIKGNEFIYVHGDLIMEDKIINKCSAESGDVVMAVDFKPCDEEAMKVRVEKDLIIESSKEIPLDKSAGEWIGVIKFSQRGGNMFFTEAKKALDEGYKNAYDTLVLTRMAQQMPIRSSNITGLPWVEIDFKEDFEKAEMLFNK
ncbi:MAG: phosphocholine cytidylyltransferase family protein [bacterium]